VIAGLVRSRLPTLATVGAGVGNVLVFAGVVGLMTFVARSPRLSDSPALAGIAAESLTSFEVLDPLPAGGVS